MPLKVCHVSTVHPVFDDRIFYKECTSLVERGNEVYFVVSHEKAENINGVNIIPLSLKEGRLYRLFVKQFSALNKAKKLKADIYHFHDPELIFMGLMLKMSGKKVVYDVHEDVPLQILNKEWIGGLRKRKAFSNTFNKIEKSIAKKLDGVVTVTTEIEEKFSKSKRTLLLRNLPIISLIEKEKVSDISCNKPVIIYAGSITDIRGIKELVQVAGILNGKVEFWLIGKFDSEEFEQECKALEGWKYTRYFGYMPMNEVYSYMKKADIGMCTLYATKNHLTSLPVKAFEYMACGIPIVMSDFDYWKDNFQENAIFVDPCNPNEIAKVVEEIVDNYDKFKAMGELNKTMVYEKYSWESECEKMMEFYKDIVK